MSRIDETRDLETSRGTLQYTIIDLIHQVEKCPVIWDRLHVDFKNGEAKQVAWNEICPHFVPFYNDLDEDEQLAITNILKARWRNCIGGMMTSVSLKQKNDRLFRPYKYAREMKFYLKTRGIKFSDIYDAEDIDGIEVETTIKTEVQDENGSPKNKKIKITNTPATYLSPRLSEKQLNSAVKQNTQTPINSQNAQQIKRTPTSINTSNNCSLQHESSSDEIDMVEETNDYMPQEIAYPRVEMNQTPRLFTNESDAADQAFFDSIKPALRKMNETQKLDFQIDILQILKSFRSN